MSALDQPTALRSGIAGCSVGRAALGEDLDRVDQPVGILEGVRVVGNVFVAGRRELRADGVLTPDLACPVSAESSVEHELVVLEVRVDITARARELDHRGRPSRRVGLPDCDVLGHIAGSREEPDLDGIGCPFHRVGASADFVEALPERLGVGGVCAAALVSLAVTLLERTARAGVQRHGVGLGLVDALEDVDLARVRPVGSYGPEGRPDAALIFGGVGDVSDEETLRIALLRDDASGIATGIGRALDLGVGTEIDGVVGVAGQRLGVGLDGRVVLDESVGGVGLAEEVETLEEAGGVVVVLQRIGSVGGVLGCAAEPAKGQQYCEEQRP